MPNVDYLRNQILEKAHGSCNLIHTISTNMYHDLREVFLWDGLKWDIAEFIEKCPNCQQVKVENKHSGVLLQNKKVPLGSAKTLILTQQWVCLGQEGRMTLYWWFVYRLTKSGHFILVKCTYSAEECERIYINDIMSLQGIPLSIISDRGAIYVLILDVVPKGLGT